MTPTIIKIEITDSAVKSEVSGSKVCLLACLADYFIKCPDMKELMEASLAVVNLHQRQEQTQKQEPTK